MNSTFSISNSDEWIQKKYFNRWINIHRKVASTMERSIAKTYRKLNLLLKNSTNCKENFNTLFVIMSYTSLVCHTDMFKVYELRQSLWIFLLYKKENIKEKTSICPLGNILKPPLMHRECESLFQYRKQEFLDLLENEQKNRTYFMKFEEIRKGMEDVLLRICRTKFLNYKTGMVELLAPFFLLNLSFDTICESFYQYCILLDPNIVREDKRKNQICINTAKNNDEINDIHRNWKQVTNEDKRRKLQLLLAYHKPLLKNNISNSLEEWFLNPNYIPNSFLDFVSFQKSFLLKNLLYILDYFIITTDSNFILFFILSIIIHHKDIFEKISDKEEFKMIFQNIFSIDSIKTLNENTMRTLCRKAYEMYQNTPKSYMKEDFRYDKIYQTCFSQRMNEETMRKKPTANTSCHSGSTSFKDSLINNFGKLGGDDAFEGILNDSEEEETEISMPFDEEKLSLHELNSINMKDYSVDMSKWKKKISRSMIGRSYWVNMDTNKSQWEHPATYNDPAPESFSIFVSVDEIASNIYDKILPKDSLLGYNSINKKDDLYINHSLFPIRQKYFLMDCRALRSSVDLKSGRLPVAYDFDPSIIDKPHLIIKMMNSLSSIKRQSHICLLGNGVGLPYECLKDENTKDTVRQSIQNDFKILNSVAILLQKNGFPYVSIIKGGYAAWHAYIKNNPLFSLFELPGHQSTICRYCSYDKILLTNELVIKENAHDEIKNSSESTELNRKNNGFTSYINLFRSIKVKSEITSLKNSKSLNDDSKSEFSTTRLSSIMKIPLIRKKKRIEKNLSLQSTCSSLRSENDVQIYKVGDENQKILQKLDYSLHFDETSDVEEICIYEATRVA